MLVSLFLLEFGDFPMNRRELLGIKRRAEALATARQSAPSTADEPSMTAQPVGSAVR